MNARTKKATIEKYRKKAKNPREVARTFKAICRIQSLQLNRLRLVLATARACLVNQEGPEKGHRFFNECEEAAVKHFPISDEEDAINAIPW